MRIAALLIFLALGSHAKAAEPIPQKQIPADRLFIVKTRYVMFQVPNIKVERFDLFDSGKEPLKVFAATPLLRSDATVIHLAKRRQQVVTLKRSIKLGNVDLEKGCALRFTCTAKGADDPVRVLEFITCAKSEISIAGAKLTATFTGGKGSTDNYFAANSDIILRSKIITEDGRILHPGNVIRLTEWIDDAETNEVELVSEKPYGPIAPDEF